MSADIIREISAKDDLTSKPGTVLTPTQETVFDKGVLIARIGTLTSPDSSPISTGATDGTEGVFIEGVAVAHIDSVAGSAKITTGSATRAPMDHITYVATWE